MTGPEHYAEAERLVRLTAGGLESPSREQLTLLAAQVHATLSLTAAAVDVPLGYAVASEITGSSEWLDVVS